MYKQFFIFSIITTKLTILLVIGLLYHIQFLQNTFYTLTCLYFCFAFICTTILFIRDKKIILVQGHKLRNTLLYILTTPIILILFSGFILLSSDIKQNNYSYRPFSDFRLCNLCIEDGTRVKVIYSSGGPYVNTNADFYYHYIAINMLRGDTFNILTTFHSYVTPSNNIKVFSSQMSEFTKVIQNLEQIKDRAKNINVNELQLKEIAKVIYDARFDESENNTYKTAIGELGEINKK